MAVDLRTRVIRPGDVKRGFPATERDRARYAAALLAMTRALRQEGVQFARVEPLRVRWFATPGNLPRGFVCRASIDEALNAKVRAVVDHAVTAFRSGFATRFRALLAVFFTEGGPQLQSA